MSNSSDENGVRCNCTVLLNKMMMNQPTDINPFVFSYTHLSSGDLLRNEVLFMNRYSTSRTDDKFYFVSLKQKCILLCDHLHQVLSGSPRGLQIFRLMETGELVPTIIVLHLLTEAMVK